MLPDKKKWLVILRIDQYTWIKDMAKKNDLKGSDILVEALDRVMEDKDFAASLAETHLKVALQELNDKAAEIAERQEALKKQYKETTGRTRVAV